MANDINFASLHFCALLCPIVRVKVEVHLWRVHPLLYSWSCRHGIWSQSQNFLKDDKCPPEWGGEKGCDISEFFLSNSPQFDSLQKSECAAGRFLLQSQVEVLRLTVRHGCLCPVPVPILCEKKWEFERCRVKPPPKIWFCEAPSK
jgi:hypothetical protein